MKLEDPEAEATDEAEPDEAEADPEEAELDPEEADPDPDPFPLREPKLKLSKKLSYF
jgi:hypothetical protein